MNKVSGKYQVVVVGGGPVGLFLGICLQKYGIHCLILEKREEPYPHSRSIGIHPVSLELFGRLNLADCFCERGVKIKHGHAVSDNGILGTISFNHLPGPYNFILSLPQNETEHILRTSLIRQQPAALIEGAEVTDIDMNHDFVLIHYTHKGTEHTVQTEYLAGCDGKHSMVRKQAQIPFNGKNYPDTYLMGDFTDDTHFGDNAVVYLHSEGLVESFPLPENKRRWVVKTDEYISRVNHTDIAEQIRKRTGHDLSDQPHFMLSSFGVQKILAGTYVNNRVALVGDAAHVVSPIGGQGMNLGWMDAWELAQTFKQLYHDKKNNAGLLLKRYSKKQKKIARKVIRQAELNTRLGRKTRIPALKNSIVWLMLNTPIQKKMSRIFTMRNLLDDYT